ncbi:MAG: VWA domain-containing protein, partial [Pseudomonadales bacterium]
MDASLQRFISALRMAEVRISPAETLDAFRTVDRMGMENRQQLKESLALVLPKTAEEKLAFDACFDAFFRFEEFSDAPPGASDGERGDGDPSGEGEGSEGQGGGGDGPPQGQGSEPRKSDEASGDPAGDGPPGDEGTDPFGDPGPGPVQDAQSALGQQLQQGDRAALALAVSQAGEAVNVAGIKVFTQKGLYTRRIMDALGQGALQEEIGTLATQADATARRTAAQLSGLRDDLRERVRDFVERQFLLHADADGHRLREAMLRHVKLSNVEHRNFSHLKRLVEKMAKRLIAAHSRRRKKMRRGQLHVSRTLRKNLRYDGELIDLAWKARKIDRSKVFAICDVSGSVATYARFMLMFLYSLEAVLPRVRAFAFSSDLGEVTENFQRMAIDDAIATTLADYSGGST